MRAALTLAFLVSLSPMIWADDSKKKDLGPIPIIKLSRKEPISYEKDVEPIFVKKCLYCHSGNVIEGKLDMSTFAALSKGGAHGAALVPGKPDESLLVKRSGRTLKPFMPPKTEEPLTAEELAVIRTWIEQGAKPPTSVREKPKVTLTAPNNLVQPVRAVAISPDKSLIISARGNRIHLYDGKSYNYLRSLVDPAIPSPEKTAHLSLVESLAISPDGKTIASGSFQEVTLWDVENGQPKGKLTGFAHLVVALTYSPDGKLLATAGGAPTEDGEVKVFEATGKQLLDIKPCHSDTAFGVCFSPDGTKLATCGADKFVKVFEIPSGKFLKSFEGHTHHVQDVGWKSDGKLLASGGADNAIKIWDFEKGEQVRTIKGHGNQITRLSFVGKAPQFVTSSGDGTVRSWNVDNGGQQRTYGGVNDFIHAVAVSADGAIVVAGVENGSTLVYNGTNSQLLKTLLPPDAEPKK